MPNTGKRHISSLAEAALHGSDPLNCRKLDDFRPRSAPKHFKRDSCTSGGGLGSFSKGSSACIKCRPHLKHEGNIEIPSKSKENDRNYDRKRMKPSISQGLRHGFGCRAAVEPAFAAPSPAVWPRQAPPSLSAPPALGGSPHAPLKEL